MWEWSAELNELEQRLIRAWVDRDRETIDAVLDDNWAVIDVSGRILTKAQVLEEAFQTGDRQIEAGTIDEVRVRTFGEVAVVTGRTIVTGTYRGSRSAVKLRFTDVCVKRGDRWQVVSSQATLLSEA
jgi:ketosteroid isomerase-like protein